MLAQDYKPAFDDEDTESIEKFGGNLNTGGTGSYCPHRLFSPWLVNRIIKEIVNPTVNEIYNQLGWAYKGVLYFGLNLDPYDRLDVFEINVRHGDPEWEVLARKLSTDLLEIGMAVWEGTLDHITQTWNKQYYVDVIAMEGRSKASRGWNKGYPARYGKGHKILGLDDLERGIAVYFAGVDDSPEKGLVTFGGRVLHLVAGDSTLKKAREKAYRNIKKITFVDHKNGDANCMRYRTQIGA
jgi:phosphoribosylamine--glycine ligase